MFKILETQMNMPHPLAIMLNYPALDFNFTSWMSPQNLRILQTEQSSGHLSLLSDEKDHLRHISPLSMVGSRRPRRQNSLRETLREWTGTSSRQMLPSLRHRHTTTDVRVMFDRDDTGSVADTEDEPSGQVEGEEKLLKARIRFSPEIRHVDIPQAAESPAQMSGREETVLQGTVEARAPIGTRLTMTSRTGYFQDRIIPPSMVSLWSSSEEQRHSVASRQLTLPRRPSHHYGSNEID